jgi:hypothetical protein
MGMKPLPITPPHVYMKRGEKQKNIIKFGTYAPMPKTLSPILLAAS